MSDPGSDLTASPNQQREYLHAYDRDLRCEGEVGQADDVARIGPLWLARFSDYGMVSYQSLGSAATNPTELDDLIRLSIEHFRHGEFVKTMEWKTRGHDQPDDLGDRLRSHGLIPSEVETVMIGSVDHLISAPSNQHESGFQVRRIFDAGDVQRASQLQADVFGEWHGDDSENTSARLKANPNNVQLWVAESDQGEVVGVGRLQMVPNTAFAGLWGGCVHEHWRGRGVYRALTSERAKAAKTLDVRYLNSDCTAMSRPILERNGMLAVTTTTPYKRALD